MARFSRFLPVFAVFCVGIATAGCDQKPSAAKDGSGVTAAAAVPAKQEAVPQNEGAPATAKRASTGEEDQGSGAPDIGSVAIAAETGANGGASTDVDVVLAYDPAAASEIGALSAAAWFDKKGTYTVSDRAQVFSWHVAPGGHVSETPLDPDNVARAVFVFARYKSPGDHRQRIEGAGTLNITLGADDFTAEISQD